MKKVIGLSIVLLFVVALNSCSTQNPNPNNNGNNNNSTSINPTFTQGPNVTDIDGNVYPSVINCNQTWTSKNLNVMHYKNGDPIPEVTDLTVWASLTTGAWCYYNNDPVNGPSYGKLYNFYAINDPRGLAPSGWHIPTDQEWYSIENCLGASDITGGAMKEIGSSHWVTPNTGATNSSGFSALPGGFRNDFGSFSGISYNGYWWSSTIYGNNDSYQRNLFYNFGRIFRDHMEWNSGFSVRCVKD